MMSRTSRFLYMCVYSIHRHSNTFYMCLLCIVQANVHVCLMYMFVSTHPAKQVKQVEDSVAHRLSQLEGELDQTRREGQSMAHKMESLQRENTSVSTTVKEQMERSNQVHVMPSMLSGSVHVTPSMLSNSVHVTPSMLSSNVHVMPSILSNGVHVTPSMLSSSVHVTPSMLSNSVHVLRMQIIMSV